MRVKKSETTFVKENKAKFSTALAAATLCVRQNPKLVGLDKIREPLAFQAALRACGFPDAVGFSVPKQAGTPMQEMQDIVDAAFLEAAERATSAIPSPNQQGEA